MTTEEIRNEIKRLKKLQYQIFIDEFDGDIKNINSNYDMGLITFEEKITKINYLTNQVKTTIKQENYE